ncbi:MAG: hypothetical protein ACYCOU_02740, partial [Sulfobacillus sp.]
MSPSFVATKMVWAQDFGSSQSQSHSMPLCDRDRPRGTSGAQFDERVKTEIQGLDRDAQPCDVVIEAVVPYPEQVVLPLDRTPSSFSRRRKSPMVRYSPTTKLRQIGFPASVKTATHMTRASPDPWFRASPGSWLRASDSQIRHQASGIRHQASGIRHQASGIRHQASGIRH